MICLCQGTKFPRNLKVSHKILIVNPTHLSRKCDAPKRRPKIHKETIPSHKKNHSCNRKFISCHRKFIFCQRKFISCHRKFISCHSTGHFSCKRKNISCLRKLISCNNKFSFILCHWKWGNTPVLNWFDDIY